MMATRVLLLAVVTAAATDLDALRASVSACGPVLDLRVLMDNGASTGGGAAAARDSAARAECFYVLSDNAALKRFSFTNGAGGHAAKYQGQIETKELAWLPREHLRCVKLASGGGRSAAAGSSHTIAPSERRRAP